VLCLGLVVGLASCAGNPGNGVDNDDSLDTVSVEQPQKLASDDSRPADGFGSAIAISGETAIVGVPYQGIAYVFQRTQDGWEKRAQLPAEPAATGDGFGYSVAISGDTALVGAFAGASKSYSVRIFERSGDGWTETGSLVAEDAKENDLFGTALAMENDTAVVGAPGDSKNSGSAYIFVRAEGSWTQEAKLAADDEAGQYEKFGQAVAISGKSVVVGAPEDYFYGRFSGTAYVFSRTAEGWKQQTQLFASDLDNHDQFGYAVAVSGDTFVIGAYGDDDYLGSAYVFVRNGEEWMEEAKLTTSKGQAKDRFGTAVAVSGDIALIGADLSDELEEDAGATYVFLRTEGKWIGSSILVPADGAKNDHFGHPIAMSGSTALIGLSPSDRYTPQEEWRNGAVYAYSLGRDSDDDDVIDALDNCPNDANPSQDNLDGDERGDACDDDDDDDGNPDTADNCPRVANPDQKNHDADTLGDACDDDDDGDGVPDASDNCIFKENPLQEDSDDNGVGDACEDDDEDGVSALDDNCPDVANPTQEDSDDNGIGDACDDLDGDGVSGAADNCPDAPNSGQEDLDDDGIGDACDSDFDGDGVLNEDDNCPRIDNPDQDDVCQSVYGCSAASGPGAVPVWMLALLLLAPRRRRCGETA